MPSIWGNLYKLLKKNHFQAVCKFKEKNVERVEENETNMEVFSVKNKNKNVEKIKQKKKDNNFDLDMQMDTRSEVTLIPGNFWEHIGKPTLRKSSLLIRQFDRSVIKILGYFGGSLELEDKFEEIPVFVTTCNNNLGLLENDVLNINFTKLINEIKMEKTGKLKNYKASLNSKKMLSPFIMRHKNYQYICCHKK